MKRTFLSVMILISAFVFMNGETVSAKSRNKKQSQVSSSVPELALITEDQAEGLEKAKERREPYTDCFCAPDYCQRLSLQWGAKVTFQRSEECNNPPALTQCTFTFE